MVDKGTMRIFLTISTINNWTVKTRHKICIFAGQRNLDGMYTLNLQERAIQKKEQFGN